MNDRRLNRSIVGQAIEALCCFTPVLVVVFGFAGLSAIVGHFNYFLLPALSVSVLITIFAVFRRARKT